jgi:hypothetical protein
VCSANNCAWGRMNPASGLSSRVPGDCPAQECSKLILALLILGVSLLVVCPASAEITITPQGNSNVAHIKVSAYTRDTFEVYFPEVIHADDRNLLGPGNRAEWRKSAAGGWMTHYLKPAVGEYELKLVPQGDMIDMEWRVRNRSREDWKYASGTADFIFSKAPHFNDPALERTFLYIRGKWVPLKDADHSDGQWHWQWYVVRGYRPCRLMGERPHPKNAFGLSRDEPELGLAAVVSEDGRMVIGQVFDRVQYFVQNVVRACIHPAAHLGDIPPSREATSHGKIYFLAGTLQDLLARYRRDFPSGTR